MKRIDPEEQLRSIIADSRPSRDQLLGCNFVRVPNLLPFALKLGSLRLLSNIAFQFLVSNRNAFMEGDACDNALADKSTKTRHYSRTFEIEGTLFAFLIEEKRRVDAEIFQ